MKRPLRIWVLLIAISAVFYNGCSDFLSLYSKDSIPNHGQSDLRSAYNIESKWQITGNTLWVYVPMDNLMSIYSKPKEEGNGSSEKIEKEKKDIYSYINDVIFTIRRVIMNSDVSGLEFYAVVFADVRSGLVFRVIGTVDDVKAVNFERISIDKFRERFLYKTSIHPEVINDREGKNFQPFPIPKTGFIAELISQRTQKEIISLLGFSMGFSLDWELKKTESGDSELVFIIIPDNDKIRDILRKNIKEVVRDYKFMNISAYVIEGIKKKETLPLIDIMPDEYVKKRLEELNNTGL